MGACTDGYSDGVVEAYARVLFLRLAAAIEALRRPGWPTARGAKQSAEQLAVRAAQCVIATGCHSGSIASCMCLGLGSEALQCADWICKQAILPAAAVQLKHALRA